MAEVSQTSTKSRPVSPPVQLPNAGPPRRNETAEIIEAWIRSNQAAAVLGALALGMFIGVMMRR